MRTHRRSLLVLLPLALGLSAATLRARPAIPVTEAARPAGVESSPPVPLRPSSGLAAAAAARGPHHRGAHLPRRLRMVVVLPLLGVGALLTRRRRPSPRSRPLEAVALPAGVPSKPWRRSEHGADEWTGTGVPRRIPCLAGVAP